MQMNIAEAKSKLSELVAAAERGDEVLIARGGRVVVRLVPEVPATPTFRFGAATGMVEQVPGLFQPLSEDELALWE
jgi:prevent-host-death family protein